MEKDYLFSASDAFDQTNRIRRDQWIDHLLKHVSDVIILAIKQGKNYAIFDFNELVIGAECLFEVREMLQVLESKLNAKKYSHEVMLKTGKLKISW